MGYGDYSSRKSSPKSRYTVLVDNVSSMTPKRELVKEMERIAGTVLAATKDDRRKSALVEFRRTSDCDYAYRKAHGTRMDGRRWEVRYATREDFKDFGWKWTEGGGYESDEGGDRDTTGFNPTISPQQPPSSVKDRSRSPVARRRYSMSPQRSGGSY